MLDDGSDIGANDVPYLKPFNGRLMLDASGLADRVSTIVNSEIFARILFSRNFAYAEFRENKTLAK